MNKIATIVEVIGSSPNGWEDASQNALDEAKKTIRGIKGVKVITNTAKVDAETGKITEYHSTVKIAFETERPQ